MGGVGLCKDDLTVVVVGGGKSVGDGGGGLDV